MEEELTTVQVSKATREKLRAIAKEDFRSMTAEFEWLVEQELARRVVPPTSQPQNQKPQ